MNLLRLELIAFGPFTQRTLDLSAAPKALHVVYGANEAGKSTALRALSGLLFGIPRMTQDDHEHNAKDLRVGALLENGAGAPTYVVRRKGDKNTLLDDAGKPTDEAPLAKMLAGVTEESFRTMFGIDHESLREGGEALVEGEGEVGQSLLGAALGSTAVQTLLARLKKEADELWVPQGHKRPLNEALKRYAEAQRNAQLPTTVETWAAQKRGIEEHAERAVELEKEVVAAREALNDKRRLLDALPLLDERRVVIARRAALAGARVLPASAARDREHAIAELDEARDKAADFGLEIGELEASRAMISVPARAEHDTGDRAVEAVAKTLAGHSEAIDEIARLEDDVKRLDAETRAALGRLAGVVAGEALEDRASLARLRMSAAAQARIRKLANERPALDTAVQRHETDLAAREREATAASAAAAALPDVPETSELLRSVGRIRKLGDVERAAEKSASDAARRAAGCAAEAVALGLGDVELSAIERLEVPLPETVDRFARAFEELDRAGETARQTERRSRERLAKVDVELEALQRAGSVPTEQDLSDARTRRDEAWQRVRDRTGARRKAAGRAEADVAAFEHAVRAADDVADRLRREAERTGLFARLLAERTSAIAERESAQREERELSGRRARVDGEWREVLVRGRAPVTTPAEARGWIARHAALVRSAQDATAAADEARRAREDTERARTDVAGALERAGVAASAATAREPLDSLLERAEAWLSDAQAAARTREDAVRGAARLAGDVLKGRSALDESRATLAAWHRRWTELLAPLPLGRDTSPDELLGLLAEMSELFPKLDELERMQSRLATLSDEVASFESSVRDLVRARAPDLAGLPVAAAADELVRRMRQEEVARVGAAHLDRSIADARRHAEEQAQRAVRADARLRELMDAAAVADLGALEEAERQSADVLDLARQLDEIERRLLVASSGLASDEMEKRAVGWDRDSLAETIEESERQVEDLESARRTAERDVGQKELGLQQLEERSVAADAAADAEQALASVRRLAARWAELRLAAAVLEREIEKWREANQGPLLARASALFERFTLGSFVRLAASFDDRDRHVLVGVRPDGREVPIPGMSDGTRDPLYLALRIAALERHAQAGETLPLVVDDVLVHLDDDRARAVLGALGELASRAQVLFFTHHTRMLELARTVVPAERLVEHRLGG